MTVQVFYEGGEIKTGTDNSVGFDIVLPVDVELNIMSHTTVPTGIHLIIPEGYWVKIEGRSSLAIKGVFPVGGIIDNDYTGEVKVVLINLNPYGIKINKGDKIAQLIVYNQEDVDFIPANFEECPRLRFMKEKKEKSRGAAGFGSTGK